MKLIGLGIVLLGGLAVMTTLASSQAKPAGQQTCAVQHYSLQQLPLRPSGINDSSQVVGTSESHRAGIWTKKDGLQEIAIPPGFDSSEGIAINNAGHIIGIALELKTNRRQGFAYIDGTVRLLPGTNARPFAINDADEIVGESVARQGISAPVLWRKSETVELGGCCGGTTSDINNHSQAIGNLYNQEGRYQAFEWNKSDGLRHIGPQGAFSSALAINNSGHVLIESFSQGILLYSGDKAERLQLSTKLPNHPKALSDCDAVVGAFGPFSDSDHAFIWDRSLGFRNLNDLVVPNSGWQLREATAINSKGEIVGWGDYKGDEDAGFLLIPQP